MNALDLTDGKSTSVQVMAWCRQATSHYLSQCWPRSMSPKGVTRPQWVTVTHWPREVWELIFKSSIFSKSSYSVWKSSRGTGCQIALRWIPRTLTTEKSTLVCNGLMLSGNKPLPEPILTQIYVAISARESNARLLANTSAFWAGRVENWPGRVTFV